jgi:hypothetical protein
MLEKITAQIQICILFKFSNKSSCSSAGLLVSEVQVKIGRKVHRKTEEKEYFEVGSIYVYS